MSALDDEAVDWGDVEGISMEQAREAGDDVISLGGAEDLEEEIVISVPIEEKKAVVKEMPSNGSALKTVVTQKDVQAADLHSRPLPKGWRLQEARSGGTYYFNTLTGKTTWDFPSEEAVAPTITKVERAEIAGPTKQELPLEAKIERPAQPIVETATKAAEVTSKPVTEKMGIQIKGAARGNNASFRKDDISPVPDTKKREAELQPAESDGKAVNNQKRRRSNTPPSAKVESHPVEVPRETASVAVAVAAAAAAPPRIAQQSRLPTEVSTEREGAVKGGWGRRADIASEAKVPLGPNVDRSRPYDQDRYDRNDRDQKVSRTQQELEAPRFRQDTDASRFRQEPTQHQRREAEGVAPSQRRDVVPESRDRPSQRDNGREPPRNFHETRRVSPREERPREAREARRETSPIPRRRDDYDRTDGRDAERSDRDMTRSRDTPVASRDVSRSELPRSRPAGDREERERMYPEREAVAPRDRTGEREPSRSYDDRRRDAPAPTSAPRDTDRFHTDKSADQRPYNSRNNSGQTNGYNNQANGYNNQANGYNNQAIGFNREARAGYQYPASNMIQQGPGYGPPRNYYPVNQYRNAPIAPLNPPVPFSPGAGPPRGPLSAGARPLKAWIPPEEKQKRWWNKNTGERKQVSADGSNEGEPSSRQRDSSIPSSSEPQPHYPANRMTDRERELAEREAAIARKERELGLR